MCLNSQICEIHSLGRYSRSLFKICEIYSLARYSREVLIGTPPPIAPQKWTRGKEREITDPPDVGTVPVAA